jgi:predicted Zn-dependent protease
VLRRIRNLGSFRDLRNLRNYGVAALLTCSSVAPAVSSELPVIANSSSIISLEEEYQLGRVWARMLRGSAPEYGDPIVVNYLENLLWQLAETSQLQDHRLQLVVLNNQSLNAFAVPGGVVGVNAGLLLGAQDEEELASVLAHELAHLSQRHYAQQLEEARNNTPLMLAGILASILVASADSQAGLAGLSSTMAASQQAGLAFSRRNEQEADRIGMQNLVESGFDPFAMPRMFSRIQRSSRFLGQKPPEFLLTHPVTESRIADAESRARQLPKPQFQDRRYDFLLIQKRIQVNFAKQPDQLVSGYKESAADDPTSRYGLALALIRDNKFTQATQTLDQLPDELKNHLYIKLTRAELLLKAEQYDAARKLSQHLYQLYPDSYPATLLYAQILRADNDAKAAVKIYQQLSQSHPNNSFIWYELAETYGLAGNTLGVHEARTEYFLHIGAIDKAMQQIDYALREKNLTEIDIARLKQRKKEAEDIREQIKNAF